MLFSKAIADLQFITKCCWQVPDVDAAGPWRLGAGALRVIPEHVGSRAPGADPHGSGRQGLQMLFSCCPEPAGLRPLCPPRAGPCRGGHCVACSRCTASACSSVPTAPAPQSPSALRADGQVPGSPPPARARPRGQLLRAQGPGLPTVLQMAWQLCAPWKPV